MRRNRFRTTVMMTGALLASAGVGAAVASSEAAPSTRILAEVRAVQPAVVPPASQRASALADMVEAVGPAVVQIQASSGDSNGFQSFGGLPRQGGGSSGSGFVIDTSGVIVTNNHVVANAGAVTVKMADGTEFEARVLGTDPKTDLAVLKVATSRPLKAVQWGDSDAARVGEDVFAVGSPFGLGNSVTSGIISARGREIGAGPYDDFLQVDASINSGNSGGPLFDARGNVVGVNTAILSPSGGNIGIGFAIPSRLAQFVVRQIMTDGQVRRGQINVLLQPLTPEIAGRLGLANAKGALIADVDPSGPAAAGGLRPGDVVVAVASRPIEDGRQFARSVAEATIGSRLALDVVRDGRKVAASVVVTGPRNS